MASKLMKIIFASFFFFFFSELVIAEEYLMFVGKLEKTTLFPKDWSKQVETCGYVDKNGEKYCEVIVSNSCGKEIIDFDVVEGLVGTTEGEHLSLKTSIGEWCEYNLELTMDDRVIFAITRDNSRGIFENEYTIDAYEIYYDKEEALYFFLYTSFDFLDCQKITGVDCFQALQPVEPVAVYPYKATSDRGVKVYKARYEELFEKGILIKEDENKMFLVQGVYLDDLKNIMGQANEINP